MMQTLEEAVKDIIKCVYNADYTSGLKINTLTNQDQEVIGYSLILALNNFEKPMQIAFEGTWENFLKYIEKELRIRRLNDTTYFYGDKTYIRK